MNDPVFFAPVAALSLAEVAAIACVPVPDGRVATIRAVASLEEAGPSDLAYLDDVGHVAALDDTRAGICVVGPRFAARVPQGSVGLVVAEPRRVYAAILARLHASALSPASIFGGTGIAAGSIVHPAARLEPNVTVDPGAVIGRDVEIGAGSVVSAGAVIGPGVRIGRNCAIGAGASVLHALIGNRVVLHSGVRIGQEGPGFALGPRHGKVPQVGRVIIQDDVAIGANTAIDRGAARDTVIGEGTTIGNLVQIAHDVVIGRHCVVAAQAGLSGSALLEDDVMLGGQVVVVGDVTIGEGSRIAPSSEVATDVPPGSRRGGTFAGSLRASFRGMEAEKGLASRRHPAKDGGDDDT